MSADQSSPQSVIQRPSTNIQISETLRVRAQELIRILQETDIATAESQLESFLETIAANPIAEEDRIHMSLDIPFIYALVQNRADRMCRKNIFCPVDHCSHVFKTFNRLSSYLRSVHRFDKNKCADIVLFFIC
jgi:predicted KAP-like P-loop ATPase